MRWVKVNPFKVSLAPPLTEAAAELAKVEEPELEPEDARKANEKAEQLGPN